MGTDFDSATLRSRIAYQHAEVAEEMKTTPEFGTTIRIRRRVFGYTQRELARLVGLHETPRN